MQSRIPKSKGQAEFKNSILDAYNGIKRDASRNVVFMKELLGFLTKGLEANDSKAEL